MLEFLESQTAAVILVFIMCVIALVFLLLFASEMKRRKSVAQVKAEYEAKIAEKDREIANLKSDKKSIGAERFEVEMFCKFLMVQLANASYKISQFTKARGNK